MANIINKYPMSKKSAEENGFSDTELELILSKVGDAPDGDIAVFLHVCRRSGLDPLTNQIHLVVRRSNRGARGTVQTGIDGYRLIADRTGRYAGSSDPVFNDTMTQYEFKKSGDKYPTTATVVVKKITGDLSNPIIAEYPATAEWEAYYPGSSQGYMWDKMPLLMLGKVAEALALRKAFPGELSGIYTNEEMDQANSATDGKPVRSTSKPKKIEFTNPNAEKVYTKLVSVGYDPNSDVLVSVLGSDLKSIPDGSDGNKILSAVWEFAVDISKDQTEEVALQAMMEKILNDGKDD